MEMSVLFSWLVATALITPLALKTFFPFLWMDLLYCRDLLSIFLTYMWRRRRRPLFLVLDRFLEQVAAHPNKTLVVFEEQRYTYTDADRISNKTAHALRAQPGYKPGDTVALFMGNEPAFMFTWLALTKLGSPVSFLNHNIRSKSLLHCFHCCKATVLIAASGLALTPRKLFLPQRLREKSAVITGVLLIDGVDTTQFSLQIALQMQKALCRVIYDN